jgi:uncharacterized membrane protein YphA (DoxX/SURF4 family)
MLVVGSFAKFKSNPAPTEMIEKVKAGEDLSKDLQVLKIKNYIFGMKQSGFFWQFLGIAELVCGILLLSQFLGFVGAVMTVPLTLNIFLFHLYLEPHEIGELIETAGLLVINLWLIAFEYKSWKHLILTKVW